MKTWISAGEYRQEKKQLKREKERQWALEILGVEDQLTPPKKSKKEQEWAELIDLIKKKESEP